MSDQATRPEAGATAGATLIPMVMNAHTTAAKADTIWLRDRKVMVVSLCSPFYAARVARGATAGATLMPMVMNAHITAAKTEAIWLREERVISISFVMFRTIPAMQELLHRVCQF